MVRITITLNDLEATALKRASHAELRDPRDQVRYMLCKELQSLGWLSGKPDSDKTTNQTAESYHLSEVGATALTDLLDEKGVPNE